jgi:hypothetical protein
MKGHQSKSVLEKAEWWRAAIERLEEAAGRENAIEIGGRQWNNRTSYITN